MTQDFSKWLLCRPTYFDVIYEINPWMHVKVRPDHAMAMAQWNTLVGYFDSFKIPYEVLEPQQGLPDLVFTANGALVNGRKAALANFKHPQRQKEEPFFKEWFEKNGYELFKPDTGLFEGEGDALFVGDTLCAGFGHRTTPETYEKIGEFLGISTLILCEMINPRFYHLDTCFAPLNEKAALVYSAALSSSTVKQLESHMELISVDEDEAMRFACNTVVHDDKIIIPSKCPKTVKVLRERKFEVAEVEMTQFMKAGGAAKCCSLRV